MKSKVAIVAANYYENITSDLVDGVKNNLNNIDMKKKIINEVKRKIVKTDFSAFSNEIYEDYRS